MRESEFHQKVLALQVHFSGMPGSLWNPGGRTPGPGIQGYGNENISLSHPISIIKLIKYIQNLKEE
jgi:hypothetical protein